MDINPEFLNSIEAGILMHLGRYQIIQQLELELFAKHGKTFDSDHPCNIYFIMQRPRVVFNTVTSKVTKNEIKFCFKIQQKDKFLNFSIKTDNIFGPEVKIVSEYPYNFFALEKDGKIQHGFKTAVFVDLFHDHYGTTPDLLDFELLYIGQSYADGKRTALDRLPSHKTLQAIYANAISNNPDSEIWLMLCNFEQSTLMADLPLKGTAGKKDNEKRLRKFFGGVSVTEQQKINFTEAALINYFKPRYNIEFKNNFPNPAHSTYSECYDLDLSFINIEVDTSEIKRCVYSSETKKTQRHSKMFNLINSQDRYNLFQLDWLKSGNFSR